MNDEKLIELVRNYLPLYDLSNKKYMHIEFKNDIWRKIGEEMEKNGTACKVRWNNIRDNFRKSLNKSKTVSGQKAKIVKPYKYADQLSFLKKYIVDRETMSNIQVANMNMTAYDGNELVLGEKSTQHDTTESEIDSTPSASPIQRKKAKQSAPNAQPARTAAATLMEFLVKEKENIASTPQHPVDAFLLGLAPSLKKLPPRYWHYAKADIFNPVQTYEFKVLTDQQEFLEPYPVQSPAGIFVYEQASSTGSYYETTSTSSTPPLTYPTESNHQAN